MRKHLLLLILFSGDVYASNWQGIGVVVNRSEPIIFIDKDSIEQKKEFFSFWQKSPESFNDPIYITMDCKNKLFRYEEGVNDFYRRWQHVKPDSFSDVAFNYLCKEQNNTKSSSNIKRNKSSKSLSKIAVPNDGDLNIGDLIPGLQESEIGKQQSGPK